jgi:hypothetical protein
MLTKLFQIAVAVVAYLTMGILGVLWLRRFGEDPANHGVDFKL